MSLTSDGFSTSCQRSPLGHRSSNGSWLDSVAIDIPPRTEIIPPGQIQRTVYFVIAGEVHVVGDEDSVTLSRGWLFGEVAWLLDQPRSRRVVAGPEGATVLGFSLGELEAATADSAPGTSELYRFVARDLARRLVGATGATGAAEP